ncbi:MAG: DMT family transporter [Sulfurospirillaceae bacterium]|jgi:drug/metabolite transporter (DMT)-like permease|nr:DMT family transporter [Sulfurospirillaceae bacterium]MDD2827689.1 DMT family transporter [Sulfurospirillaceae bacterium]
MKGYLPVIILLGASILWGLSWLPLKAINAMGIEGISLSFGAYGIIALVMSSRLLKQRALGWKHRKVMFLIALLGGGANLAFTYSLINGEVIRVMVLFYLLPVWGVLGGYFFLKERIDVWRWFGVIAAVLGAFLILGGFKILDTPPSWIDALALLSGLLFALNNLLFRFAQPVPVASKIGAMFYGCFILAGLLLLGHVEPFPVDVGFKAWGALGLYALVWLLIANIGSQWGVTHMEAGRSSIIIIMELITAVISATLIAGETMDFVEYIGGFLILSAALIEALRNQEDEIKDR